MITAIVDTGGANLGSVTNALDRLERQWVLTTDISRIRSADHVILPGVGTSNDSMKKLQGEGIVGALKNLKKPVLGICLGMQLLYESSEEGDVQCLGIIPGRIMKISAASGITVPHMGWNRVTREEGEPLFKGIESGSYFYFVHSFQAPCDQFMVGYSHHGHKIPAVVKKGNFYGVQFHPERSGENGSILLRNFLEL